MTLAELKARTRRWIVPVSLTLFTTACPTDSPTAPTLSATGKWSATLVGSFTPGGSGVMVMTLSQAGSTVSGTGTFTDPADPPPGIFTATGSVTGTNVSLTIQFQPQQYMGKLVDANKPPLAFAGTLTATSMNGNLSGGGTTGLSNVATNFVKQ